MNKAIRPKRFKSFRNNYVALFIIVAAFFNTPVQGQFTPDTDSLRRFNAKYIRNSAIEAFTNLRLNTLLKWIINEIDSTAANGGGDTFDSTYIYQQVNLRLKYIDTALMLQAYMQAIDARLQLSDTAAMLAAYLALINDRYTKAQTDVLLATKANTAHTHAIADVTGLQAALDGKQASLGFTAENVANKDIDATFAANSDTKYPSQKAVKTAVDLKLPITNPVALGLLTTPNLYLNNASFPYIRWEGGFTTYLQNAINLSAGGSGNYTSFQLSAAKGFAIQAGGVTKFLIQETTGNSTFGIETPHASSLLELYSTTKAFRLMRMSTTQRDAITGAIGHMVYDSVTNKFSIYDGSWGNLSKEGHTHTASNVTDFQTAVSANTDVAASVTHAANTSNPHSVTKSQVGLGSVENTQLSTWAGSTNLVTLGTIGTGTWNATAIGPTKGGTNQTTWTLGDLLYSDGANTLAKLAGNITTTRKFLNQTGNASVSAAPVWSALVAGDIPDISATYQATSGKDATGGYVGMTLFKTNFKNAANTFTSFLTNSNTAARTYTFPDRDMTVADNADVATNTSNISTNTTNIATNTTAMTDWLSTYRTLLTASGSHIAANTAATYALPFGDALVKTGVGTVYPIATIYLNSADYPTVNGKAPKLRIRVTMMTNDAAPTGTYTFGLHGVSRPGTSGGIGVNIYTIAAAVTGSNGGTISSPAADLITGSTITSADFDIPSSNVYCIGMVQTGTVAANSMIHVTAVLQIHNP